MLPREPSPFLVPLNDTDALLDPAAWLRKRVGLGDVKPLLRKKLEAAGKEKQP
jgi:hypothetical protein